MKQLKMAINFKVNGKILYFYPMLSQSIPLYFHKAPIRIYNKIINKKGKFWRLWLKKVTTYHL